MIDNTTDFFKIEDNFAKTKSILSIPLIQSKLDFEPKVTIAIPTYKRPGLLKEALDSAINQIEYADYDIVIVDNNPERGCETEQLMNFYNNPRISYYKNEKNIGMFNNWNRCIELSKGSYLTILNDDDILNKSYLITVSKLVNINERLDIDGVVVGFQRIDSDGRVINCPERLNLGLRKLIPLDLLFGNINPGSLGILFLKKNLMTIGGFDDSYYPSADYMLLVRYLASFTQTFYTRTVLTNYRLAVNESNKISAIQGFFDKDKKIRECYLMLYPRLRQLIEYTIPVIEYNHYHTLCEFSIEFKEINANNLLVLKKNITFINEAATKIVIVLLKTTRFLNFFR